MFEKCNKINKKHTVKFTNVKLCPIYIIFNYFYRLSLFPTQHVVNLIKTVESQTI